MSITSQILEFPAQAHPAFLTTITVVTILWTVFAAFFRPSSFHPLAPPPAHSKQPLVGSIRYFTRIWDFFQEETAVVHQSFVSTKGSSSSKKNPFNAFSFHLGRLPVVGFTGHQARKLLFTDPKLDFQGAYDILFGGSPNIERLKEAKMDMEEGDESSRSKYFVDRLKTFLSTDSLTKLLPTMMSEINTAYDGFGDSGTFDPFNSIYNLIFRITLRAFGCREISDSPELLTYTLAQYKVIDAGNCASAVIAPWFPTPTKIRKLAGGTKLYLLLKKIMAARKEEGRREEDPLQVLMDRGDSLVSIITMISGALIAGLQTSGINSSWILCFLGTNPEWLAKVRGEVEAAGEKWGAGERTLKDKLMKVPLDAWETEFPLMNLTLKESIRLSLVGAIPRLNRARDIKIGDYLVPQGTFVTYPIADIHSNSEIYTEPGRYDPQRYLPGREEDKKVPLGYVGWGAGRHPCQGMRFAKLEISMTIAFFIAQFDWEVGTESLNRNEGPVWNLTADTLPMPDLNKRSTNKPDRRMYIRYRRRDT